MNTKNNDCDHKRIDAFLNSDHVALDAPQLVDHLDTCAECRNYIETQAAEAERWANATELLKPTEFDRAGTVGCSAATIGHQRIEQPIAVKSVLDSLAPSGDPNRLGRLGGYEVSGVVGVGGMGVVLKAVDSALDRVVAIKVMAPHLANNGTARRRFSREAKAAAAVLHPNVVPIHCVSSDEPIPYLVMAYIRGGSLQTRLQCEGPLTTVEILRIGSQVAAGLAAAHEQGLVHRDIKPENILLEDGVERVTLTDFGLARAVDDASVTREGTIAGTPQYMSPEQARGESVDQTSDLFSLGSVLYALCTGRPPFRAETSYGVMRRIIDENAVPIREINPEIPDWLAQIVEKLMTKDKASRFDSAKEVHTLLESCLSHVQQPTHAELPDSLRTGLVTTKPQGGPKAFFTSRIVVLTLIGILAAMGLIGINSLASRFALAEARKAFTQAQAELDPQFSSGNPTNAVSTLLNNENGPGFLLALDAQFKHFTYDLYLALDGKSEGAVFIWNRSEAPASQMLIRTNGKNIILKDVLPKQIHVTELRIEKSKLLISYTTSDREADQLPIDSDLKLRPGASYETAVEIATLLNENADWIEPFKNGRLVSSRHLQDEPILQLMRDADDSTSPEDRIILDQGYTIFDGGKEIGSRHLVVTGNDETLSIVEEYSLGLQFDGAPLGIVERNVSAVYTVAGDTPLLIRGTNSTKEQGALVMDGTVELENGKAEMKWTAHTERGRKLDRPSQQLATGKTPPGPLVLGSTIQVVGPLLLPKDGDRIVGWATFNNRVRKGRPLVEFKAGCTLKRTSRLEGAGFTITLFEPDSDKPEMIWEYDSQGNCESVQLASTTVMKPHEAAAASENALTIEELLRRESEGLLNPVQLDELVDLILEYQADRERPWRTEMGDLIEKRWVNGKLDRKLWEQYTAQFVVDIYEIKVRPRIVIGTPGGVNLQLEIQDVRCGSGKHITFEVQETNRVTKIGSTIIGGNNIPGTFPLRHQSGGRTMGNSNHFGKQTWESIRPGKQKITFEAQLAIVESSASDKDEQQNVFASRKVTFEAETTFLPRGQTTVNINTDPSMKPDVDRSITIKRIKTGPAVNPKTDNKYYSNVILDITPRPIDIAFEIILKDGDNEYTSGSVTSTSDDKDGLNSMAYIPADLSGKRIDVIFRPAPDIAEDTVDLFEIWGEEIVFKNVLVSGESVSDSGK